MSRCFPYPPPGYERARTHDDALIELIKLQREEKAKKDRRKEKKREKKEKEKTRNKGEVGDKKHSHKRRHKDERSQEDQKVSDHHKRRESETEQVEKSNLTEEKGNPITSQNLCNSTESTSNNSKSKRQKHSSPPDGRHNSGSILRIRLPLQRHKDPEVLPPSLEQPCSSRRTDGYVQEKCEAATLPGFDGRRHPCSTPSTHPEIAIELGKEKPCFTPRAPETTGNKAETGPTPRLRRGSSHPLELQFRNLLENWVPTPLQLQHTDFDDQNWLFETTQNRKCGAEGSLAISDCLSVANSTPWPLSRYLPEADIYALPFTIPF